jgi:hypothetical protein
LQAGGDKLGIEKKNETEPRETQLFRFSTTTRLARNKETKADD